MSEVNYSRVPLQDKLHHKLAPLYMQCRAEGIVSVTPASNSGVGRRLFQAQHMKPGSGGGFI